MCIQTQKTETIRLNRVIIPLHLAVLFYICYSSLIINIAFFRFQKYSGLNDKLYGPLRLKDMQLIL